MGMRKLLLILSVAVLLPALLSAQGPMSKLTRKKISTSLTTYLFDTFTDANFTNLPNHSMNTGGGWSYQHVTGCVVLSSGAIQSNTFSPVGPAAKYTADATVSDCVVSCDMTIPNAATYASGLMVRFVDCSNYWFILLVRDASNGTIPQLYISETTAGTQTNRAVVNVPGATNSTVNLKVTLSGTSIVALVSTGETTNYTSSSHQSATKMGFWAYTDGGYATFVCDNFLVTN